MCPTLARLVATALCGNCQNCQYTKAGTHKHMININKPLAEGQLCDWHFLPVLSYCSPPHSRHMPGMSGPQVASRLRDVHPRTKILFLTMHEQPEYVSAAFSAGGRGYVTKRRITSDLAQAIREVFEGETFLSPIPRK